MKNIGVGTRLSIAFALVATVAMCSGIFDMIKISQINKGAQAMHSDILVPLSRLSASERQVYQTLLQLHEIDPASKSGQREKLQDELIPLQKAIKDMERAGEEQRAATERLAQNGFKLGIIFIICTFIFAHSTGLVIKFSITRPLKKVVGTLKEGSKGDMRARSGVEQQDEIGIVAGAVDNFFENIQGILKGIHTNSQTLAGASEKLSSVSKELARGAEETAAQSNIVASTTGQMAMNISAMANGVEKASANANEAASSAEQMSENMSTIAAAVEEMSASINQIAGNTIEVSQISTEATEKVRDATEVMNKLGAAAQEIGHVTDLIKKIADKTNLLALNATIEAASAGEYGKGFAVVAGEIKELANQSGKSADDITRRIDGIQSGTNDAVEVIQTVSDIINKINNSVEAIAGHAGQQTKASNEISHNVSQANTGAKRVASAIGEVAKGTNDVSHNAGEAAGGAKNVSSNAVGMNKVAKESSQGASAVNKSAGDLAKIASELRETVSRFTV